MKPETSISHEYSIPEDRPKKTPANPEGKPTGDFTGRCWKCGSNDLWDDNLTYGCNSCGMLRIGS